MPLNEKQVTRGPGGRVLTNIGVWSPDAEWIVCDTRSDAAGSNFDGRWIEMVHADTGEVRRLYSCQHEAHCGVATFHPHDWRTVFIRGPEQPTPDWQYNPWHREGMIIDAKAPGEARHMDARNVVAPFTAGALRGGSHVHVWEPGGVYLSFTYEDHVLAQLGSSDPDHDPNLRNVGVSVPGAVQVPSTHPRNHGGDYFSVLVTHATGDPRPGTDEIRRACEEGWVGKAGYRRPDDSIQRHAIAFQGEVITTRGQAIQEVFIVDLPKDLTVAGNRPLQGTSNRMPAPPAGTVQRRLTHTQQRKFPGLSGPRHWLRSSPDGSHITFLMKDDAGVVQLWTISPMGGEPRQLTRNQFPIASTFTWSPDGQKIAHVMDRSVCITGLATGKTERLTDRSIEEEDAPRPEACVISPDGARIAYVRQVAEPGGARWNQIFTCKVAH